MKSKIILPPLGEASFNATEKWQALCVLNNIPQSDAINEQLTALAQKLNLPATSPVWDQIILAFNNRSRNNLPAQAALNDLKHLLGKPALSDLSIGMYDLQSQFIAMFAAQEFTPATYHFYGHGKEMSEDPGNLTKNIIIGDDVGKLLINTINALGAAHDIIQDSGSPKNEKLSAEIFVTQTQKMIDDLIEANNYSDKTINILQNFRDLAIPFLAEECIVNATYLLFANDKRDFDNILTQVHNVMEQAHIETHGQPLKSMTISKEIRAMKLAMALADTRRSEIKSVLRKHVTLDTILLDEQNNQAPLIQLLVAAGILNKGEKIPSTLQPNKNAEEKLMRIEGFLLRLGQNIRMTSELAVHHKKDPSRKQLIQDIRSNKMIQTDCKNEFESFLNTIEGDYGEAAFAKALGAINNTELLEQINQFKLETMVNEDNFDFRGWIRHEENLLKMKKNLAPLSGPEKSAMGKLLFTIAAKSPGHKVGQETYDKMKEYRKELVKNPQLLTNLNAAIAEIKAADPNLRIEQSSSGRMTPGLRSARSSTNSGRERGYSDPLISLSPKSPQPSTSNRKFDFKDPNGPTPYEIDATNPSRRGSVPKPNSLAPLHLKKGLHKKAVSQDEPPQPGTKPTPYKIRVEPVKRGSDSPAPQVRKGLFKNHVSAGDATTKLPPIFVSKKSKK
jgi:hypothetical protein